ncbi:hypothetical protein DAEQUDRAFT_190275 [Daedalea quercina L-15889]|uniref:Yeast cell wall synthesis Kre9/Knh1-like N-terminal domain-containing protein n=1 Tax=Daedalea quercina L-15889 TaxID=1314783 RepID=A0A165U455_9APHY|nr:hypothetical protein DAEQUDRAFT_190275 [Daedalea quercina L-15889]
MSLPVLAMSVSLASLALADVTPTAPGPNETFIAGFNCTVDWDADMSGTWKNMTIDLMSGSNDNMSTVTNVASGLDGTDASFSPLNWTCPEVDPYSAIYFYQFTNGGNESDAQWTTRFTIASSSNTSVPPEQSQQPNGDPIPWGVGVLASSNTTNTTSAYPSSSTASGNVTSSTQPPTSTATNNMDQPAQSAISAVKNVNVASAHTGSNQNGDSQNDSDGQDSDDDNSNDDDDGDDDGDEDEDGGDENEDGGYDEDDDDGGDSNAKGTDATHHTSSGDKGNTDGSDSSVGNSGKGDSDSGSSRDADGSGDSDNSGNDADDDNYGTFTGTKTLHHMHPTQVPDTQDKDVSSSNSQGGQDDDQDTATSSGVPSSRMEKQRSSKATASDPVSSAHSDHPSPSATGTLDPTLSIPSNAARVANTESQVHAAASESATAQTSTTTDGLNDIKLASAGTAGISAAVGPAWLYLLLAAVGVVPQVVGH